MNALRVAFFLAWRQIKRSNPWTTALIIFIMMLTFLNLVVVSGILVGLPEGARLAYSRQYSGEIIIRPLFTETTIKQTPMILRTIRELPEVEAVSPRYIASAVAESNYKTNIGPGKSPDKVNAIIAGIQPSLENAVTHMGKTLIDGEFLVEGEEGSIVVGKNLLEKYALNGSVLSIVLLRGVDVGDKVRLTVNGNTNEYTVKGVVSGKINEVSTRIFMNDRELRRILNQQDQNVGEISLRLKPGTDSEKLVGQLQQLGFSDYARIETARQSQGTFLDDIAKTFTLLSNVIGGIGIMVASITVFIVVFINAVTRRKYIGILKGIGISGRAIEVSYMLQSVFYGTIGSLLGLVVVYQLLKPYFDLHPINFPFADGLLLVPLSGTLLRVAVLLVITVLAGYIPARMIVRQNTLDAILGR